MRKFLTIIAVGALAGCGQNEIVLKKQMELEARIEHLVQNYAGIGSRLNQLDASVRDLQEKTREQATAVEEMKLSVRQPAPIHEETIAEPVTPPQPQPQVQPPQAVTKIEVINPEPAPREKEADPADAYMKAFGLYGANKYAEAVEAFSAFLKAHPDHEYAANAQYWIGECYYSQSNLVSALDAFRKVVEKYPKSGKVPDALLKIGYTQYAMKEPDKGRATLESLVAKYPSSHYAVVKAKEKLNRR